MAQFWGEDGRPPPCLQAWVFRSLPTTLSWKEAKEKAIAQKDFEDVFLAKLRDGQMQRNVELQFDETLTQCARVSARAVDSMMTEEESDQQGQQGLSERVLGRLPPWRRAGAAMAARVPAAAPPLRSTSARCRSTWPRRSTDPSCR